MLQSLRTLPALFLASLLYAQAPAQQTPPAPPPAAAPPQNQQEMAQHDEPATFKTRVNLVVVPVVIRNRKGDAVGNLTKEDFTLYDKGKVQEITRFAVEKTAPGEIKESNKTIATPDGQNAPLDIPDRFVAYVFDDIHIDFGDLVRAREAAARNMAQLARSDRAAIFTTSGQVEQEFTDDRDKLNATLLKLRPRPIARVGGGRQCPDISYYQADLIQNKHDPDAMQAAIVETIVCMNLQNPGAAQQAQQFVDGMSMQVLTAGQQESRVALLVIKEVIRRMSGTPGQRIVILAGPGFITPELQQDKTEVMDRAVRANVIVNTLDARGLYTDSIYDASRQINTTASLRIKAMIDRQAASAQADVMAELAAGTGGTFYHNNNDFDEGFRRLATAPEYVYLLQFSPQNLKFDGSYHSLKVSLKNAGPLTLEARKGYYAPKHLEDVAETAKREIEEALFSREEMSDLPVQLKTQFFKSGDQTAKVAVLAHLDIKKLKFRKADGRNNDNLTVVSGLFDRNGNYVQGITKTIEFHLKDETLETRLGQGVTVRTSFDVKPGTYLVRLVVRDSEGQLMSAANGAVEIP
jgi:VWFA-related protein